MDYNSFINFTWGSEPQARIKRSSLARKWMFIKPDCGNLSPAAQMPFCSFCVVPYFGGYPSGFSTYEYCAWATPKKIENCKLKGFTHFSFSGCGDLHNFHNYFLIKPSSKDLDINKGIYCLDGFNIRTDIYSIYVHVNDRACKYEIDSKENIVLFPGFHGLTTERYTNQIIKTKIVQDCDYIHIDADYPFLHLLFSIKIINGKILKIDDGSITLSNNATFYLSFSLISFEDADKYIKIFDIEKAKKAWNNLFLIFNLEGERKYKELFLTSLMFALKKPYIFDEKHVYDFATMWDVYKTLLPLIFLFYPNEGKIIANNMLDFVNSDGLFYHTILFSKKGPALSDQAICLMNISLSTAACYGVDFDIEKAKKLQKREIEYYLSNLDKLDRTTYLLDLSDAIVGYYNAYNIDLGLEKVQKLIDQVFEDDKIYLDKSKTYYEGNYSNYSFRVSASTLYRLQNKDKLLKALDKFFGFHGLDTIRFTKPTNPTIVKNYMKRCKRFEGLNNEPDMESMYLYSFLGNFAHQNKVIKDVIDNSYSIKNNGVPGNDDNGGLSSWLALNLLGIFPVVGTNKIKIGLPYFDEVKVRNLTIKRYRENKDSYVIKKVTFNGNIVNNEVTAKDIIEGGLLEIYLK